MSSGLNPPEVIGEIPSPAFDVVYCEPMGVVDDLVIAAEISDIPESLLPIFRLMASFNEWEFDEAHSAFLCSSFVEPGTAQREEVATWHIDDGLGLNAISAIPTEYLVADEDVIRSTFGKKYLPLDHPSEVSELAEAIKGVADDDLWKSGFKLWQPKPYEVVEIDGTHLHRAGLNRTNKVVHQIFAALILGL